MSHLSTTDRQEEGTNTENTHTIPPLLNGLLGEADLSKGYANFLVYAAAI